ncbi:hypothetical protein AAFF_G00295360 [Aldrovandia affinis]|uniref:Uncharacterized protein n=1 Tax=Aldrovandia affinis TaxID=143900 RepID=A0AAD7R8S8_9TELE|nr:hypothetical protein AAFF_G00295360 [Aldrovandia affinis]
MDVREDGGRPGRCIRKDRSEPGVSDASLQQAPGLRETPWRKNVTGKRQAYREGGKWFHDTTSPPQPYLQPSPFAPLPSVGNTAARKAGKTAYL